MEYEGSCLLGMTLLLCYMLRNDAFDAVYFVPAESGLWNEEKKTMNQQPITSLKGIGEKTAKLFAKLGVETVEELLHDYPRAYDAYEEPVPIGKLREKEMLTVNTSGSFNPILGDSNNSVGSFVI